MVQKEVEHRTSEVASGSGTGSSVENTVKAVTEYFVPGGSLITEGRLKEGGIHLAAGLVGKMLIGPVGWFLVAANSYSNSVARKSLVGYLRSSD